MNSISWKTYFLIVIVGCVSHGLLVINDGSYGDGRFVEFLIGKGDWDAIRVWYRDHGAPWIYWLYKFLGPVSNHIYKGVSLICLLAIALLNYQFLTRYSPLSERDAFWVSVLALVWPFYHMLVWSLMFPAMLYALCFYGGWFLLFYHKGQKAYPIWYGLGLLLVVVSFLYPSFLVLHFVFVMIYFLFQNGYPERMDRSELISRALRFSKGNWFLILVPFIFHGLRGYNSTASGEYAQYNAILISLKTPFYFLKNIVRTLVEPVVGLFHTLIDGWWILLPALLLFGVICIKKSQDPPVATNTRHIQGMVVFGLLMIMAISFGPALTAKTAKLMSIKSRHVMFAGMGAGLVLLATVRWLTVKGGMVWRRREGSIMALILISWIAMDIYFYLSWQARWAKDRAITYHLQEKDPLPGTSIYFLRDRFRLGVDPRYNDNDFTFILNKAWGKERTLGIAPHIQRNRPDIEAALEQIQKWKNNELRGIVALGDFKPEGCMAEVTVASKEYKQKPWIGLRYLGYKWMAPDKIPGFFDSLVKVERHSLKTNAYGKPCK
jgi:hypothetical protein